jgi:hypothetical protein
LITLGPVLVTVDAASTPKENVVPSGTEVAVAPTTFARPKVAAATAPIATTATRGLVLTFGQTGSFISILPR